MASIKTTDLDRSSFPHRLSLTSSSLSSSLHYKPHPRTYSHTQTLSVGAANPTHRISRRKSSSSTAMNKEAVVAAIAGQSLDLSRRLGKPIAVPKQVSSAAASMPNTSAFSARVLDGRPALGLSGSPSLDPLPENDKEFGKNKTRRASDAVRPSKDSKKSGHGELKCETCGKGYKHSSCLTKHLWEHTPEWQLTSKLLISKHQQVQLLEAASVLIAMNQEIGSAVESDSSSAEVSSSSDHNDSEMSSVEMTPPPQVDALSQYSPRTPARSGFDHAKQYSEHSSSYSRSYQSSIFSEGAQAGTSYAGHYRQWSMDGRPTTSGTSTSETYDDSGSEQADLAAAVGLLSCSFGTPKSVPATFMKDVPPVPPLPMQFLGSKTDQLSGSTVTMSGPRQPYSYLRGRKESEMEIDEDEEDLEIQRANMPIESLEDDEGMFGKMEE